jgi:uncharacterized membrane protein YgcG
MWHGMRRRVLTGVIVTASVAMLAPAAASAAIGTPGLTLTPSSATAATTANLGADITFTLPSGDQDSVKDMTLELPPGLIANASLDGGACLKSTTPLPACQVGSGSVTANENTLLGVPLTLSAEFTLVAPPAPGDLAGLDVLVQDPVSQQFNVLGTPAAVSFRPPDDPAGYGLNIAFTGIPDTYPVLGISTSISVTEINSTFDGLRFPSTCPATPARFSVAADSYSSPTVETTSEPLTITGCASAPYAPAFAVSAARDSADKQVTLTTAVTQTADQATSRSVSLAFPSATLAPNLASIKALCTNLGSGTCAPVGSASATSPLYPTPLSGEAYLTGSASGLSLTLVFPAPFSLTLTGQVSLVANSASFTGLPDIPLTNLDVTLDGGANGLFLATCETPSGTATATLTSQNGDKTVSLPSAFTVTNCTAPPTHSTGTGSGPGAGSGGSGGSGGSSGGAGTPPASGGTTRVVSKTASGLRTGKPRLAFKLASATGAPKLSRLTVELPSGLSFTRHRVHGKLKLTGVSLKGAKAQSVALSHGHLVITLRTPSASVTVTLSSASLKESAALRTKVKHGKVKSLKLTVIARNAKRKSTTLRLQVKLG